MIKTTREDGHRWPRMCSYRVIAHDGVAEVSLCNNCLAVRVTQVPDDGPTVVTVIPAPYIEV